MKLQEWLSKYEAAHYLSQKIVDPQRWGLGEASIKEKDVLRYALEGHLRLVVYVPVGLKDIEGRSLEEGLWDLVIEGERGKPGRQQIRRHYDPNVSVEEIDGAWVERDGCQRQLEPVRSSDEGGFAASSAFSTGCVLGVSRKRLDDLSDKLLENRSMPPA